MFADAFFSSGLYGEYVIPGRYYLRRDDNVRIEGRVWWSLPGGLAPVIGRNLKVWSRFVFVVETVGWKNSSICRFSSFFLSDSHDLERARAMHTLEPLNILEGRDDSDELRLGGVECGL